MENLKRAEDLCKAVKENAWFHTVMIGRERMSNNKVLETSILSLKRLQKFFSQSFVLPAFKEKLKVYSLSIEADGQFTRKNYALQIPYNYSDRALFDFLKELNK